MHMTKVPGLLLVLLCCELCLTIKVPVTWAESANSEVKNGHLEAIPNNEQEFKHQDVQIIRPKNQQQIPTEYFEYTAQKPKFAADIAAFHGVQNPEQHYKAQPVRPHTGKQKPTFGTHQILNSDKIIYQPFQKYVQHNENLNNYVKPTSSNYEIFHPYRAEEPALQVIYKDPVLAKIRNDLHDSKNRLQAYEQQAGEPNIETDEYLESPEKTDAKLFPHKNVPVRYEIHRPERRPTYYEVPSRNSHRDQVLNRKLKHPWNQNVKVKPMHYRPLHNHVHRLRQQHAVKYDDERNEYPQVPQSEDFAEPQDGYDIYEKGQQKYTQLRNNLDESVNQIVQQNRPVTYQKLELQKQEPEDENDDDKEEFVPIKNYAQVRKTETFKHLPKKAAYDDAETYEEIINAPRLREAVKSTKAQTVYSEEGYEDSAYDHAGEQKHASDHEGHGGFLKQHEVSGGLYKIPTVSGKYQDGKGSQYRDNTEHGKKWKHSKKDDEEETESEDYSSAEQKGSVDAEIYSEDVPDTGNRNKRQDTGTHSDTSDDDDEAANDDSNNSSTTDSKSDNNNSDDSDSDNDSDDDSELFAEIMKANETKNAQHEVDKREANFKVPEIDINSTLSFKNEVPQLKVLNEETETEKIQQKYPYYFQKIKGINKNSPLRYAENLKFIPKKSDGGTEFYDSRSQFECPEVEDDVDPLPDKLKNGENPTEEESDEDDEGSKSKGNKSFETAKEQPRLKGLGDKIDCFKAKYFGENPLDSPFFKEEIISNPEPIIAHKLPTHTLKNVKGERALESKINNVIDSSRKLSENAQTNIFVLLDKLRGDESLQESFNKINQKFNSSLYTPQGTLATNNTQQASLYSDILENIKDSLQNPGKNTDLSTRLFNSNIDNPNMTYNYFQNKEEVTKLPPKLRKKRASNFVYEPYKIIRDSQVQDSKKTTTTSNISPLIKQLQSSRVAERVSRSNKDDKQIKSNTNSRTYIDIGRKDRTSPSKIEDSNPDTTFVDVSIDNRRGEPRYELRPTNHKSEYTPVENKKAMTLDAYKSRTTTKKYEGSSTTQRPTRGRQRFSLTTTPKPYYDVSQLIPKTSDIHNAAASNTVKNTVTNSTPEAITEEQKKHKEDSDEKNTEEDYEDEDEDEDEEEEDNEEEVPTTTTTSTPRPSFRRRIKVTTTEKIPEHTTEPQRLKLVTRFRNYKPDENTEIEVTERPKVNNKERTNAEEDDIVIPKYREKKKKSHTSTLVTDTKKYGDDDDDDTRKEEVDALIGIKHDMRDYTPMYEKEEELQEKLHQSRKHEEDDDENGENNDDEDYDDEDEDDDEEEEEDDDDDGDDDSGDNDEEEEEEKPVPEPEVTTPEPTKRSLVRTTDAPPTTVATQIRSAIPTLPPHIVKPETKPIVTRKKIEIHKELPVNKSSPHVTQFKQDIKEVEIIKEIPAVPKKKPSKNVEVLNLYKDDELAKAINNLGDVEIFRENLDLDSGPKHGGNYRKATKEDLRLLKPRENLHKDAEASQSENTKHVELDDYTPKRLHGGNLKSLSDIKRTRNSGRSSKLIELTEPTTRGMHGGNFKYDNKRRGDRKNEKLIELDDDRYEDNSSRQDDDYKSHSSGRERMHGGNYKSAKLVIPKDNTDDIEVKNSNNARRSAAELLNSFAQAVPILTTTPGYIVDPSKRMYYYVEA